MIEIPKDIENVAADVARSGNNFFDREHRIAKAIFNERLRCAAIARESGAVDGDYEIMNEILKGEKTRDYPDSPVQP